MAASNATDRRSMFSRLVHHSPVILLFAVALLQVYQACGNRLLTPAKGGGFGLFSTVDKLNNRLIHIYVSEPNGSQRRLAPGAYLSAGHPLREPLLQARAFPSHRYMAHFIQRLAAYHGNRPGLEWRLEIWRLVYHMPDGRLSRQLLGRYPHKAAN